ncbi:MAG: hypothetical protein HS130_13090 [Deltaproteobacteria bacterium]|nr:hypothetical protein [Deltaproteobacteria bacterium]MBE7416089.1 hypothetical protein [Deltaproteobacteria bacterium]MCL4874921.1 hypothetical protein [bacterium]
MKMAIILATLFAFLIPVAFVLWREWRKGREKDAREGIAPKKKEPVPIWGVLRATFALLILLAPVYFISDPPYAHYNPDDSLLKVAFKQSGQRVEDCDEGGLIRQEGERYRGELKDARRVQMDIARLAKCSRERHPVMVEVYIDGEKALDRSYAPTGLKKDMASYVYSELSLKPGERRIKALMYNAGTKDKSAYAIEKTVEVAPGDVKVIWFSDKAGNLALD